MWIAEGYSVRQLSKMSKHSRRTLKGIINYWLAKFSHLEIKYMDVKYLLFDGTYFKHENCLMVIMDNNNNKVIANRYVKRENFPSTFQLFREVSANGVCPAAITVDGNTSVIKALKAVWPDILIQRCIIHIQRQGLAWLRRSPQSDAAKALRKLLLTITDIKTTTEKEIFITEFKLWEKRFGLFVASLDSNHKVYSDLQKTRSLVIHALPDMFHYLDDNQIAKSTNKLEGYFSRLKQLYRLHSGLNKQNRSNYFNWYIYFKNH